MDNAKLAAMAVNIVSAYVSNNRTDADDVVSLLNNVGSALRTAANPTPAVAAMPEQPKRKIVRRRGGKVVEPGQQTPENEADESESLIEDAGNDELVEGGEEISDEENIVAPAPNASDDDQYNEHGHKKLPEPMFD